jgi:hypothetical protein
VTAGQLALPLDAPVANPNAWMFHPDGSMKMLMWPGDGERMMHERDAGGGYAVPRSERMLHGCCSARCPRCNPEAFRCAWGCCPPRPRSIEDSAY